MLRRQHERQRQQRVNGVGAAKPEAGQSVGRWHAQGKGYGGRDRREVTPLSRTEPQNASARSIPATVWASVETTLLANSQQMASASRQTAA